MARPIYETTQDRTNAKRVGIKLMKLDLLRVPVLARLNEPFNVIGTLEEPDDLAIKVKCVNYSMPMLQRWGGVFFSKAKWEKCRAICEALGAQFWFVVETTDGVWVYRASPHYAYDGTSFGGRTDRGDPKDKELLVLLGLHRFEKVA